MLRAGNYPNVIGSTRFSGSLQALTIQQSIGAPYNASAKVLVREPLAELSLDGELTLTVQPAELGVDLPSSTVDSNFTFEGTLERLALFGRVELSAEQLDRVEGELQAAYADGALQIENLRLAHPASAAAMQASGRLAFAPELALDLRGTWSGLQWPLRGQPQASSESGQLAVRGTLDEYVLSLDANLATAEGAAGARAGGRHRNHGGTGSRPDRNRRVAGNGRRSRRAHLATAAQRCDRAHRQ